MLRARIGLRLGYRAQSGAPWPQVDVKEGLRADPSAQMAQQLGIQLFEVNSQLPLYDGVTGRPVPKDIDDLVR